MIDAHRSRRNRKRASSNPLLQSTRKLKSPLPGVPLVQSSEINDIGLTRPCATVLSVFRSRGGGLCASAYCHPPRRLLLPEQASSRPRHRGDFSRSGILRESRERARLKYLFLKQGWTAATFLEELQSRLDFKLLRSARAGSDDIFPTTWDCKQRQPD